MSDYYDEFMALSREDRTKVYRIENDMSFSGADEICCPYCNTPQYSLDDADLSYEQDAEHEIECQHFDCGKKFTLSTNVSYSWNTQVPDEEALEIFKAQSKEDKS